jgi:hypothetical protein
MADKSVALSVKPTELRARYRQLLAWKLDRRSKIDRFRPWRRDARQAADKKAR